MNLCSQGHEEIVYDRGYCPACELVDEIDTLKRSIETLEDEIRSLQ